MRITAAIALLLTTASTGVQGFRPLARQTGSPFARAMSSEIPNTVEEWKSKLNAEQFEVLRRKATEPPGYSERKEGQLEYELKKKEDAAFANSEWDQLYFIYKIDLNQTKSIIISIKAFVKSNNL